MNTSITSPSLPRRRRSRSHAAIGRIRAATSRGGRRHWKAAIRDVGRAGRRVRQIGVVSARSDRRVRSRLAGARHHMAEATRPTADRNARRRVLPAIAVVGVGGVAAIAGRRARRDSVEVTGGGVDAPSE
jgi:hypothetical protein